MSKTMSKKRSFGHKKPKTQLSFDVEERKQFLTGFRKRKAERQLKAKELMEIEIKEEKVRQRVRQRERLKEFYENQRPVPEVEHLLDRTVTYELPQQLVSITAFDANDISGQLGLTLGHNRSHISGGGQSSSGNDAEGDNCEDNGVVDNSGDTVAEEDNEDRGSKSRGKGLRQKILDAKKESKRDRLRSVKTNSGFKRQQTFKHSKDVQKSKQKRKMIKKEIKSLKQKSVLKKQKLNQKKNRKNKYRKRFTKK